MHLRFCMPPPHAPRCRLFSRPVPSDRLSVYRYKTEHNYCRLRRGLPSLTASAASLPQKSHCSSTYSRYPDWAGYYFLHFLSSPQSFLLYEAFRDGRRFLSLPELLLLLPETKFPAQMPEPSILPDSLRSFPKHCASATSLLCFHVSLCSPSFSLIFKSFHL